MSLKHKSTLYAQIFQELNNESHSSQDGPLELILGGTPGKNTWNADHIYTAGAPSPYSLLSCAELSLTFVWPLSLEATRGVQYMKSSSEPNLPLMFKSAPTKRRYLVHDLEKTYRKAFVFCGFIR